MYSSLMGTFDFPPPTARIDTISSSRDPLWRELVQTPYSSDPGTLASSVTTSDDDKAGGIESLMSVVEPRCESIYSSADNHHTPSSGKEIDGDVAHSQILDSTYASDCSDIVFPSNEAIFEAMTVVDRPLEDLHRRSYFYAPMHEVESWSSNSTSDVCTVPSAPTQLSAEGSILIGSIKIPINISRSKLAEPPDGLYLKKYFA